jgi:hypothetical protein
MHEERAATAKPSRLIRKPEHAGRKRAQRLAVDRPVQEPWRLGRSRSRTKENANAEKIKDREPRHRVPPRHAPAFSYRGKSPQSVKQKSRHNCGDQERLTFAELRVIDRIALATRDGPRSGVDRDDRARRELKVRHTCGSAPSPTSGGSQSARICSRPKCCRMGVMNTAAAGDDARMWG